MTRRHFLAASGSTAATLGSLSAVESSESREGKNTTTVHPHDGPNRIGVSSYSF